jgi:hypothetical protein
VRTLLSTGGSGESPWQDLLAASSALQLLQAVRVGQLGAARAG